MAASEKGTTSQTLSRGLRVLEVLAEAPGLSIDELAQALELHRSIAYRLVRTLEEHRLVARDGAGRLELAPRLAVLAAGVASDLQEVTVPELTAAADELGMTCFLAVADGGECVTLASVEPRGAIASVAQRPGARHSVLVGAPGKAILAQLAESVWPAGASERLRGEVAEVRARGFATSHDEVIPTVRAVAVPLLVHVGRATALAAIHVSATADPKALAERLGVAASAIRARLGG